MERVNDPWLSTLTLTPSRRCGTDDCLVASRPSPSKRDRSSKGGRATERERLLGRAGPVGHRFQVGDPLPDLVASGFMVGIGLGGIGENLAGVVEMLGVEEFSEPFLESGE